MSEQCFKKKSTLIISAATGTPLSKFWPRYDRHVFSSFVVQETIYAEPKDVKKMDKRYFQLASESQVWAKFDRELW